MRYVKKTVDVMVLTLVILAGWGEVDRCKQCDPAAYAQAVGYFGCLVIVLAAFICRKQLRDLNPGTVGWSKFFFVCFGVAAAIVVQGLFWFAGRIVNSPAALNSSLGKHLVITTPWYAGMLVFFCWSHFRYWYSWRSAAMLGGLYQLAAEGGAIHHLQGGVFNLAYFLYLPIQYGLYVVICSAILLPAVWAVECERTEVGRPIRRFLGGLVPLVVVPIYWVILYLIFVGFRPMN